MREDPALNYDSCFTDPDLHRERRISEEVLRNSGYDFSAKYLAAGELNGLIRRHCEVIRPETVYALEGIMYDPAVAGQKQAYFLYREAAQGLSSIFVYSLDEGLAELAFLTLKSLLRSTAGAAHRAAAEALGSLPLNIVGSGPPNLEIEIGTVSSIGWDEILKQIPLPGSEPPRFVGRSLMAPVKGGSKLIVAKLAGREDKPVSLVREGIWMEHLRMKRFALDEKFEVPEVIRIEGCLLFSLDRAPTSEPFPAELHPARYAVAYVADKDYFSYPNGPGPEDLPEAADFEEMITRNSWLFGRLASLGILHSAPIPLFHNRVQGLRRNDGGLYEWPRGGRLDRWLDSCSYPNFGRTGIRDFEHFSNFCGPSRNLYLLMGKHLLSLFLVSGSYFRNRDRGRVGLDAHGNPLDARDLFDFDFMERVIGGIFLDYYRGFVGKPFEGDPPFSLTELTRRMIDEMGVDRHMEEILRIQDQQQMSRSEFEDFLSERGYGEEEIKNLKMGVSDIVMQTGPHLGGFNERISLPEMIDAVAAMAAICVAGRYREIKRVEA